MARSLVGARGNARWWGRAVALLAVLVSGGGVALMSTAGEASAAQAAFGAPGVWSTRICLAEQECTLADVDADGTEDVVAFVTSNREVWVATSRGSGFNEPRLWLREFCLTGQKCTVADVDGDGRADAVAFAANAGHTWVAKSTSTSFAAPVLWLQNFCVGTQDCEVADVDGDRAADAVAFAGNGHVWVARSKKTVPGFHTPELWSQSFCPAGQECELADVNGDFKADAVAFVKGANHVWVATSTGTGFGAPAPWLQGFCLTGQTCTVGDVNGDGMADAVAFAPQGPHTWVALSTGIGFGGPQLWSTQICVGAQKCTVADVNGDGTTDAVAFEQSKSEVWVAPAPAPLTQGAIVTPELALRTFGRDVTLLITDRSLNEGKFVVWRRVNGGSYLRWRELGKLPGRGRVLETTDVGTNLSTERCYRVEAVNDTDRSRLSDPSCLPAQTPPPPPPPPTPPVQVPAATR